ncbi:phage tail tube protein [Pontiella sp.]|uniref:phage tail tube protein n=1 Tax=Pontiella sp. TaxID=2837462 RepID=UPI003563E4B4
MGAKSGYKSIFSAAGSGDAVEVVGDRKSWKISTRAAIGTATAQGQDWEETLDGIKGFDLSVSGNLDPSDNGQAALEEGALVDFEAWIETGGFKYSGSARIKSLEIDAPEDGPISFSFSAQGHGALSRTPAV